jgi:hypothetical protein
VSGSVQSASHFWPEGILVATGCIVISDNCPRKQPVFGPSKGGCNRGMLKEADDPHPWALAFNLDRHLPQGSNETEILMGATDAIFADDVKVNQTWRMFLTFDKNNPFGYGILLKVPAWA